MCTCVAVPTLKVFLQETEADVLKRKGRHDYATCNASTGEAKAGRWWAWDFMRPDLKVKKQSKTKESDPEE